MATRKNLLLEIGTEEMPAEAVNVGITQLANNSGKILCDNHLSYSNIKVYGSPRRLALLVKGLSGRQNEITHEVKGPAKKVAYTDEGDPTLAAMGFAKSQGVDVRKLVVRETPQGDYVFAIRKERGKATSELLPRLLPEIILSLSFPKSMRWDKDDIRFSRPIRWLVALYGSTVVKFSLGNLKSSNLTWGHRYLVSNPLILKNAINYEETLRKGKVIVDLDKRRDEIRKNINKVATKVGGKVVIDPSNFAEVTNLVEYPHVIYGTFAKDYLKIPRDVLVIAIQFHQRYFPVESKSGRLLPGFIVVHNGEPKYNRIIRKGHERVLQARLADAKFFFEEDKKSTLESKVEKLKGVVFHERLGTLYDKQKRIQDLTEVIGKHFKATKDTLKQAKRAAHLCKADLVTEMVTEFPALQGVMGREYASLDGETDSVSQAIFEHYLPRTAQDMLPRTTEGKILSLADKIDSIVGCFVVGLAPTGSEDPYSLRRQAQGIISIILENSLRLSLASLIRSSLDLYKRQRAKVTAQGDLEKKLGGFFKKRLRVYLLNKGFNHDVLDAVLALGFDDIEDVRSRTEAISEYRKRKQKMDDLLTAFTRCNNLCDLRLGTRIEKSLLRDSWERKLYAQLEQVETKLVKHVRNGNYPQALETLAQLRSTVDTFFDEVLVMVKDRRLRKNRVALLNKCVKLFFQLADFSKLVISADVNS